MEVLFGDTLVRFNKEAALEEAKITDPDTPRPSVYTSIAVQDSLATTDCKYIVTLFTAEYAPPCVSFLQAFTAFC
jgi:hypothetical protein